MLHNTAQKTPAHAPNARRAGGAFKNRGLSRALLHGARRTEPGVFALLRRGFCRRVDGGRAAHFALWRAVRRGGAGGVALLLRRIAHPFFCAHRQADRRQGRKTPGRFVHGAGVRRRRSGLLPFHPLRLFDGGALGHGGRAAQPHLRRGFFAAAPFKGAQTADR